MSLVGIEDSYTKQKYLRLINQLDRIEMQHIAKQRN